jgi:F-type H+-transporting ATPase subunit epsilon
MIQFDLVSPEKKLFSAPVAMVTLPGMEGDFSVLPGHAPFISSMRVGVIDVYEDGSTISRRLLVGGGLVEVNPDRCTALAEDVVPLEDVSRSSVEEDKRNLQDRLAIANSEEAREKLEAAIALATKKLEVLELISSR